MKDSFTYQDIFSIIILSIILGATLFAQWKGWLTSKFEKLKTGDKIKVHIYADEFCDCYKEAIVVGREGRYIVAQMTESEMNKCRICCKENHKMKECWYHTTYFTKHDVKTV